MLGMKNSTMLKCYQNGVSWDPFILLCKLPGTALGKAAKQKITEGCWIFLSPLLLHGHSLLCLVLDKHLKIFC